MISYYDVSATVHISRQSTHDEAAIDSHTQAKQHENECDLIGRRAQSAGPESGERSQRVHDRKTQWQYKYVLHGKMWVLGQVSDNHHANGVGIDESSIEDEGYQVVIENDRVQVEVKGDLSRGCEVWNEAVERLVDRLLLVPLDLHNMQSAMRYPLAFKGYLKYDA